MTHKWLLPLAILLYFPFAGNECKHVTDDAISDGKPAHVSAHFTGSPLPGEQGTLLVDGVPATVNAVGVPVSEDVAVGNHTISVTSEKANGTWSHTLYLNSDQVFDMACECKPNKVTIEGDPIDLGVKNIYSITTQIDGKKYGTLLTSDRSVTYEVTPGKHLPVVFWNQNNEVILQTSFDLGYGGTLKYTVN